MKTPTVAQILLQEQSSAQKKEMWDRLILTILLLYIAITLLNIYFTYSDIFTYFKIVDNYYAQLPISAPFGAWKVVLSLEYPILKYTFNNNFTPQLVRELIENASCFNENQCKACGGVPSTQSVNGCFDCSIAYCQLQPVMMFGDIGQQQYDTTNWTDPNNPFSKLIPSDAKIVLDSTSRDILFKYGLVGVLDASNYSLLEFYDYAFKDTQSQAPCKQNWGGFISGIGSSILAGIMAGSIGNAPGAIIGGIAGAVIGAVGNYKQISC